MLANQIAPINLDYFKGQTNEELVIEAELELSIDELQILVERITGININDTEKLDRFCKDFGNTFWCRYSTKVGQQPVGFSLKNKIFEFRGKEAFSLEGNKNQFLSTNLNNLLSNYFSSRDTTLVGTIKALGQESRVSLSLIGDPVILVRQLMHEKVKIISEIRKRPTGENKRILESLDGGQVADVLSTLKNGSKKDRAKFELIKTEFNKLFPNLRLEVSGGPGVSPGIVIDNIPIDYELPIENVGAGIGEMIFLLTLLIASKDLIFGLDLPEIQFHPHTQRTLQKVLEENSKHNQIIVITHSPILLSPEKIENISIIKEETKGVGVKHLPEDYFENEEKMKIERILQISGKEFFFSRAALLVEGPTETGALPLFAQDMGKDFDILGISIICTGKYFALLAKLLQGFDIPYVVITDNDALMYIEDRIKINGVGVRTSPVFANLSKLRQLSENELRLISNFQSKIVKIQVKNKDLESYSTDIYGELNVIANKHNVKVLSSDFEGILRSNGCQQLLNDATSVSDSKVIQGRFVAEKIIQQKMKIPQEFAGPINNVAELASVI